MSLQAYNDDILTANHMLILVTVSLMINVDIWVVEEAELEMDKIWQYEGVREELVKGERRDRREDW